MEKTTLYSRDSKESVLEWNIEVKNIYPTAQIIINEGLLEGKKTETINNILKGKNLGKMNATTAYEQAVSQAKSRIEKKRKQGYKTLEDLGSLIPDNFSKTNFSVMTTNQIVEFLLPKLRTDTNNLLKPMKAQQFYKDNGEVRIKFPCIGQPKLNGFRVICRWEEVEEGEGLFKTKVEKPVFRSKEGLSYTILEHIEKELKKEFFFRIVNGKKIQLAFDGELYIHKEILSEISSAVRKRNRKTINLQFCIFDLAIEELTQDMRTHVLRQIHRENYDLTNVNFVLTTTINSNIEAQNITDHWINNGYEGAIFRDLKAKYQFGKRPQTMVKLKRFKDKEFIIKDVVSGENSPELGVFVCIAENGELFKVTPEGTYEQKEEYLNNKNNYIGKLLTVKFFERTVNNVPFHAVGVTIRDYE